MMLDKLGNMSKCACSWFMIRRTCGSRSKIVEERVMGLH